MEVIKREWKKNLVQKWRKCRSQLKSPKLVARYLTRSKTWHSSTNSNSNFAGGFSQVTPEGCFSVYVGPEKKRFVIKAEFANHPLFQILLEDAEMEYGFNSDGPILLPCDVNLFYRVLAEVAHSATGDEIASPRCSPVVLFSPVHRGYSLLSPSRFLKLNQ